MGPRNPGFYKVSLGIRRHSQVWGPLGSAAKLGVLPGGRVCGWRGRWYGRLVSKALACSPFHGLDTPSLSQPPGGAKCPPRLPSPSFYSSPEGSRGAFWSLVCVWEGTALEGLASRAQRAMGRKQEYPGGLRPQVGSLPRLRPLAFLLGCHQSCRVLMSLGAQRTSCARWGLLHQEQGSSRSRDSWSAGGAQSLCSHLGPKELSMPWVIWEAAPGVRAVHGA